jgi:hypothetical protein
MNIQKVLGVSSEESEANDPKRQNTHGAPIHLALVLPLISIAKSLGHASSQSSK